MDKLKGWLQKMINVKNLRIVMEWLQLQKEWAITEERLLGQEKLDNQYNSSGWDLLTRRFFLRAWWLFMHQSWSWTDAWTVGMHWSADGTAADWRCTVKAIWSVMLKNRSFWWQFQTWESDNIFYLFLIFLQHQF